MLNSPRRVVMALARLLAAALVLTAVSAFAPRASAQWAPDGTPVCTAFGGQDGLGLVSDGTGGVIVAWVDGRTPESGHPYAQRLNGAGQAQWIANGIAVCDTCEAWAGLAPVRCVDDGSGGAIVVWSQVGVQAQRIDASGTPLWSPVSLTEPFWLFFGVSAIPNGLGGAIIGYNWSGLDWVAGISTSSVSSSGDVLWFDEELAPGSSRANSMVAVPDGAGGVIAGWRARFLTQLATFANRIDQGGSSQWDDTQVSFGINDTDLAASSDGQGGAWFVWRAFRFWERVLAVHIDGSGSISPHVDGTYVSTTGTPQMNPVAVPDGIGGAIIAWEDHRSVDPDIYVQRLDGVGALVWADAGIPICDAGDAQSQPVMIADGSGGAIVAWQDSRSAPIETDVYAQRIDADGTPLWVEDGVPICTAAGNQNEINLISDGSGGAIIVWRDERGADSDIYAQRVTAAGVVAPVVSVANPSAIAFRLAGPNPNPTHGATTIAFELPHARRVHAEIFGIDGRLVRRLAGGEMFPAGHSELVWDGGSAAGSVSPGLYFIRVRAGLETATARIVTMN
jgi:hypothetical protein